MNAVLQNLLVLLRSKKGWLFLVATACLIVVCYDGLDFMVEWWGRDEYSHGVMIPFVALYLLWQKRNALMESAGRPSVFGYLALLFALFLWLLGEVSSIYTLIQYAFLVGVFAISLLWVGMSGTKVIWAPLFYLVFMIPLPNFLYFNLSQELQLISSTLGVAVVRWFGVSVYLEGNVIDLGTYQLQVVEACNGLRYLFPLMSFGFLISYIYKGPIWQKIAIFLSTIPITVLMNSFRIGVIGVTVEYFGIAAAEGFLHDFEGWIVFMACIGVLLIEIWIFYWFGRRESSFADRFDLDFGGGQKLGSGSVSQWFPRLGAMAIVGLVTLVIAVPLSHSVTARESVAPDRLAFSRLPLSSGVWRGREDALEQKVLKALKLSDYFVGNFQRRGDASFVNLYSAWYEEQRKGASIHSPKSCLPGGGWKIHQHTIDSVDGINTEAGDTLRVNRVVMQKGDVKQLVYYWFQGRDRNVTNEYLAKWYIFVDSLTKNRTDGALIRLVTMIPENSNEKEADDRLKAFLAEYHSKFPLYIPN